MMDVNSWMQNVLTGQCIKTKNIIKTKKGTERLEKAGR